LNPAHKGSVPLFPTVLALKYSQVHVHLSNSCDVAFYVKAFIDEAFSLASALDVPDVQPDDNHVQFRRYLNNSWPRDNSDIIEDMIILDDYFNYICHYGDIGVLE